MIMNNKKFSDGISSALSKRNSFLGIYPLKENSMGTLNNDGGKGSNLSP